MDKITFFYGRLDPQAEYHWFPLCFPLLSAYLDLDKIEVVVIDERIEQEATLELIDQHVSSSIFFGISSFTGFQLSRSIEIAKYVKAKFPDVPIVWGGSHVTAVPVESLKEDFVDIVVVNRGESILPILIDGLKKRNLKNVPGIFFKKNGNVVENQNSEIVRFDSLPPWPYEVLKIEKYLNPKTMIVNLTTSWGCSNKCTFCFWYKNYNPWSGFAAEKVFEAAKYFREKYGIKKIYFNEANYFMNLERSLEIAKLIKPLGLKYTATARVDELSKLNAKDFKQLEDSGLYAIFIGLESGSPRILKLMNKRIDLEQLKRIAKNSRNTNILLFLSLLFQVPGEGIEDIKMTYDYIKKLKKLNPHVRRQTCSFTPLPNLPLTRLAVRQGLILPKNMDEWSRVIKKSRFEKKDWLSGEEAKKYEDIFNRYFPESQTMVYDV